MNPSAASKKGYSLARLVAGAYILSIVLILVVGYGFIQLSFELMLAESNSLQNRDEKALDRALKDADYKALENGLFLGPFWVLEEDGSLIYAGNDAVPKDFSKDELSFISEVGTKDYYESEVLGKGKHRRYLLMHYGLAEESDNNVFNYSLKSFLVLDDSQHILFSSSGSKNASFSKEFLDFMIANKEEFYPVQKQSFTTRQGEEAVIVFQLHYPTDTGQSEQSRLALLVIMFTLVVAIITILFGWMVSRSVRRPIAALNDAMTAISNGDEYPDLEEIQSPTEFSRAMNTFRQMSARLSESEAVRARLEDDRKKMLSDISHDLKTPITVISGYAEALYGGMVKKEDEKEYLEVIRDKSALLTELIQTFYEYSRMEDPRFSLSLERGDICEFFRSYLAAGYSELSMGGYDLVIHIPEEPVYASYDSMQLVRAFENIVSNTRKYNPDGCEICGELEEKEGRVFIRLGDNGVGFPENMQDCVFEPFAVGEEARTSGKGTGLGLAIAQRIVAAHGGSIRFVPNERFKVMFEIELPVS